MRYALLIHQDEELWDGLDDAARREVVRDYYELDASLREAGQLVDAGRLRPSAPARTVRSQAGELVVTDGPFADTKEQLAGYLIVDVDDLEAATAVARRLPFVVIDMGIEVREMMELPPAPAE